MHIFNDDVTPIKFRYISSDVFLIFPLYAKQGMINFLLR